MQDIRKALQALLVADSTLRTLLGGTTADPRIYAFYKGDATIDPDRPAYITMALLGRNAQGAIVHPTFSMAIWGRTQQVVENVRDRLVGTEYGTTEATRKGLLNQRVFTAASGRRFHVSLTAESEHPQPNTNYFGKTVQVQAAWLKVG
jgi:hypothetical protein